MKLVIQLSFVAFMAVAACIHGCTDAHAAVNAAQALGLREVRPGGYAFFACGSGDFTHTEFSAVNAEGKRVSGVVCCGLVFKMCTVRFQ